MNEVEVAEALVLTLPSASEMEGSLDATQLLTGTYGDRDYTMQAQLEWRPGSMALAGLNVWGTVVFSIAYDGSDMQIEGNPLLMQGLRAEYVLADILLTFWERPRLDRKLRGDGLAIVETPGRRTITRNGLPIVVIDYENESPWDGHVRFEHLERGYVLHIQTLGFSRS